MYRRKVALTALAVFAIGVAFAAQPTLRRPQGHQDVPSQDRLWVPGTKALMSAYEPNVPMPAPR